MSHLRVIYSFCRKGDSLGCASQSLTSGAGDRARASELTHVQVMPGGERCYEENKTDCEM